MRAPQHWIEAARRWYHRKRGIDLDPSIRIAAQVKLRRGFRDGRPGKIQLGEGCELDCGVLLDAFGGAIALEKRVFLGPYTVIYGHGGVTVGEQTLIAMHCRILSSNHTVPGRSLLIRDQPDILRPTRIGRDVWLGAGVTVLGGVAIGNGCVVGAGSVVTKDLPPYCIAWGVPAKITVQRPL